MSGCVRLVRKVHSGTPRPDMPDKPFRVVRYVLVPGPGHWKEEIWESRQGLDRPLAKACELVDAAVAAVEV